MTMQNFLRNRESTRDFREKEIPFKDQGKIEIILDYMRTETKDLNFKYRLYENGESLYTKLDGKVGYGGVMIKSPHYIVIERDNNDKETIIRNAYYAEELITKIQEIGIDTCWVSLNDLDDRLKNEVFGSDSNIIEYIIAVGYGVPSWAFDGKKTATRKPIDEIVFKEKIGNKITKEELSKLGLDDVFYYSSFAPSNKNLQPWRFTIEDTTIKIYAAFDNWEDSVLTDIGIIMYYFQHLLRSQGVDCKWKIDIKEAEEIKNVKYKEIASICM